MASKSAFPPPRHLKTRRPHRALKLPNQPSEKFNLICWDEGKLLFAKFCGLDAFSRIISPFNISTGRKLITNTTEKCNLDSMIAPFALPLLFADDTVWLGIMPAAFFRTRESVRLLGGSPSLNSSPAHRTNWVHVRFTPWLRRRAASSQHFSAGLSVMCTSSQAICWQWRRKILARKRRGD